MFRTDFRVLTGLTARHHPARVRVVAAAGVPARNCGTRSRGRIVRRRARRRSRYGPDTYVVRDARCEAISHMDRLLKRRPVVIDRRFCCQEQMPKTTPQR
jgi:hypothetical protein